MTKLLKIFLLLAVTAFAAQPIMSLAADDASGEKKGEEEPECD